MGERGFTLVEVLVAFVILAVAVGSAVRSIATGLEHERIADAEVMRLLEARSLIDRLGADIPLVEGERSGRLASGEPWRLTLEPRGAAAGLGLWEARLVVLGADGRSLALRTVLPGR